MILEDLHDRDEASAVAHKVLGALTKPLTLEKQEFAVTASAGLTVYPEDSRNPTLDNRAPTLRSATPELYDSTQRQGSPPEDGAFGTGMRRSEGLRAPGLAEPGRLLRR